MAPKLFDASSVVDVLLGSDGVTVGIEALFDHHLLDLTMYETANALWKVGFARDQLTHDELDAAMGLLVRLHREVTLERATGPILVATMDTARRSGCTFYDASYVTIASHEEFCLVTEDGALRTAAMDAGVATISATEL